jgi:hypothetical protein
MSDVEDALSMHIREQPDFTLGKEYGARAVDALWLHCGGWLFPEGHATLAFLAGLQEEICTQLGVRFIERIADAQGASGEV